MKRSEFLPLALAAIIVVPATAQLLQKPPPPPPAEEIRPPEPTLRPRPNSPQDWFSWVRPRCTPSDFRLVTDLNPPPPGPEGTGYKAACYALARQVPSARALLLSLPAEDRIAGASRVYEVAQGLTDAERHDVAGPLLDLVLEFWPNHSMAAGAPLTADARRMIDGLVER